MFRIKQGLFVSMALLVCILMHNVSAADVDTCPGVVLHTCDQLSEHYTESVVEKCKKGMHVLWKRGTANAKEQLNIAAIVEQLYERKNENNLPVSMRMGGSRDCTGANAAGLACGVASLALGLISGGIGALLGLGCTAVSAGVVGLCGA